MLADGKAASEEYERWRYEQARAWLEHVRGLSLRVQALTGELEAQRELADGLCALPPEAMAAGTPSADGVPNAVIRLQALVESYCAELAAYMDEQDEAHRRIAQLRRPEHSCAISAHYLSGHTWERVCCEMGYTWDGMMSLRRAAISALYDRLPDGWREAIPPAV